MSTDVKFSKTQISEKIQSVDFLVFSWLIYAKKHQQMLLFI